LSSSISVFVRVSFQQGETAVLDLDKQLAFLKSRGYEVGESFVPPDGRIHTWVAGRACAFEHVEMLVALENMKSGITTIESSALTDFAALCRRAADANEATLEIATKARALETKWRSLVLHGTPPPPSLSDKRALDVEAVSLADQMVSFLARELPNLSVLSPAQAEA
jgi:hypothetical protein